MKQFSTKGQQEANNSFASAIGTGTTLGTPRDFLAPLNSLSGLVSRPSFSLDIRRSQILQSARVTLRKSWIDYFFTAL